METLISAYNPDYSKKAAILTGKVGVRVTVEVEDFVDAAFWRNILQELRPEKDFHFNAYQSITKDDVKIKAKGKSRIIKMSNTLTADHIACIDSDYDWLLSDFTEYGKVISANKYLLQTYSYSIENLMCEPHALKCMLEEVTEEETNFDFVDYIDRLSAEIYPLLIWSLFLCSRGNHDSSSAVWAKVLSRLPVDSHTVINEIHDKISIILEQLAEKYKDYGLELLSFERYLTEEKNLVKQHAFLYVRGHNIADHLVAVLLRPLFTILKSKHNSDLKQPGKKDREKLLAAYNKKAISIERHLYRNYRFKDYVHLYSRISEDVRSI